MGFDISHNASYKWMGFADIIIDLAWLIMGLTSFIVMYLMIY